MKKLLLFIFCIALFAQTLAQSNSYRIEFEDFEESRGDSNKDLSTVLPYSEIVLANNGLNSMSGLGATFNFHGNIVFVDQYNRMDDGSIQVVLRREDGRDFFGYKPTLKAVLRVPQDSTNQ